MLCPFMPVTRVMVVHSIRADVHGNNLEAACGAIARHIPAKRGQDGLATQGRDALATAQAKKKPHRTGRGFGRFLNDGTDAPGLLQRNHLRVRDERAGGRLVSLNLADETHFLADELSQILARSSRRRGDVAEGLA